MEIVGFFVIFIALFVGLPAAYHYLVINSAVTRATDRIRREFVGTKFASLDRVGIRRELDREADQVKIEAKMQPKSYTGAIVLFVGGLFLAFLLYPNGPWWIGAILAVLGLFGVGSSGNADLGAIDLYKRAEARLMDRAERQAHQMPEPSAGRDRPKPKTAVKSRRHNQDASMPEIQVVSLGDTPGRAISTFRKFTGASLTEAKTVLENLPAKIDYVLSREEAAELKSQMEVAGAKVEIADG